MISRASMRTVLGLLLAGTAVAGCGSSGETDTSGRDDKSVGGGTSRGRVACAASRRTTSLALFTA